MISARPPEILFHDLQSRSLARSHAGMRVRAAPSGERAADLRHHHAQALSGRDQSPSRVGPILSNADKSTRSWLWLGAGHRVGIQNLPAGRPPTADRRRVRV